MNRVVMLSHGLLALYLTTLLSVPKVQSTLAALVCLTAIAVSQWKASPSIGQRVRESWVLLAPLLGYAAMVLGQILGGMLSFKDADQLLMCLLAAGVLLSRAPRASPAPAKWLYPAASVGAIGAFGLAAWQAWWLDILRPYGHLGVGKLGSGAIKFGDLAALLGLFSLLLLISRVNETRWRKVLGAVGALAGAAALALTQVRGGVFGVVAALVMLIVLHEVRRRRVMVNVSSSRPSRRKGLMVLVLAGFMSIGAAYWMGSRFADIGPQIERFQAGDQNSEIGQRLVLWGVAWRAGLHAPFTGVGLNGFVSEVERQRADGELPADSLVLYGSAHNEYLAAFAGAGFPGLVLVLWFFIGPMVVGVRRFLANQRPDAALGLVMLSTAFSVYSLTDAMFERQISMLAYLLLSAWLMAASGSPANASTTVRGGHHA